MTRRHLDWPSRLAQYFEECRDRPFELGAFDCVLFACGALAAMTGVHPVEQYIGQYHTEMGAARTMKNYCGGGVAETAEKIAGSLGLNPVHLGLAKSGDLVLTPFEAGHALAVIDLDGRSVRAGSQFGGLTQVPVKTITACWSFN